jgi:predicted enzyme related to lactoylglutathione lyase
MNEQGKINYLEIPASDLLAAKEFFTAVFDWSFEDYGPEYTAFSNAGVLGGFFKSDQTVSTATGSALVVIYSGELEATQGNSRHLPRKFDS